MSHSRLSRRSTLARMGMLMGCVAAGGLQLTSPVLANETFEFRVVNEVFKEKETKPIYETLTVFVRGLVYDFQVSAPKQTTIFDHRRGKITLLDPARKLKCVVETSDAVEFAGAYKKMKTTSDLFEFAKAPVFEVNFIDAVGELRLNSKVLNYRATGVKPKVAGAEREYRIFADHSARLDAMQPGLPPFPRMELNRELEAKGLVPAEIERKIKAVGKFFGTREETVRSTHSFNWAISEQDRHRIVEADDQLVNFDPCAFDKFFPEVATAKAAANNRPAVQTANR